MLPKTIAAIAVVYVMGFVFSAPALAQTMQSSSLVQAAQTKPEKAEEIAVKRTGGGTVVEIELERKYQQILYDIEIRDNSRKYGIKIDAKTAEIVHFKDTALKRPHVQPKTQSGSLIQDAQITFAKAEEIAVAQVGGGTVMEINLERKYQQIFYEVEIRLHERKHEIKIDAETGEVVKSKSK
jgi:uncharacterized membrane protein YkoI